MVFVTLLLLFVDTGKKRLLVFASFAGGAPASHYEYHVLPPVVALSFAAPVIRFFHSARDHDLDFKKRLNAAFRSLTVVATSYFSLHRLRIANRPTCQGPLPHINTLMVFHSRQPWCPAATPADIEAAGLSKGAAFDGTPSRPLWKAVGRGVGCRGGLVLALQRIYPDHMKANALAKRFRSTSCGEIPWPSLLLPSMHYSRGWRREVIKELPQRRRHRGSPLYRPSLL